jgi:hypothetical protein
MSIDPLVKQQLTGAFAVLVVFFGVLWAFGLIRPL